MLKDNVLQNWSLLVIQLDCLKLWIGVIESCQCMQGVQENCFFFKSIADATSIRQRICESFERAALPGISDEVCILLTFPE